MRTRRRLTGFTAVGLACTLLVAAEAPPSTRFQVNVDMVVLTFTVIDSKGRYVKGLHSEDIRVREDGMVQKIVAFTEGNESRTPALPSTSRRLYRHESVRPIRYEQLDVRGVCLCFRCNH